MGVASGCSEQEVGVASGNGWNLWVWLLGVVLRRYIDFLILLIPTPLVYICSFLQQHPYFLFIFLKIILLLLLLLLTCVHTLSVAVCTLAGDPYSPTDLLLPWLHHQAICSDKGGKSLFLKCAIEKQHRIINLTFHSSLSQLPRQLICEITCMFIHIRSYHDDRFV